MMRVFVCGMLTGASACLIFLLIASEIYDRKERMKKMENNEVTVTRGVRNAMKKLDELEDKIIAEERALGAIKMEIAAVREEKK